MTAALRPYLDCGSGLIQMLCPDQRSWGGVLKRRLLWPTAHPRVARAAAVVLPIVRALRRRYKRLAHAVAPDVADYLDSGCRVRGIVGVAGSPSCGVRSSVDLRAASNAIAARGRCPISPDRMSNAVVARSVREGRGIFIEELVRHLERRQLTVPLLEWTPPRA